MHGEAQRNGQSTEVVEWGKSPTKDKERPVWGAVEFLSWKNEPVRGLKGKKGKTQIQFSVDSFLVEGKESLGCNGLERACQM